ncbi:unnamed protein product [Miscanthus lutarioriparius]|uniref:Uncharacterized protein n=1 Tax=Miscanthus lutarioriparius TaxID=422564 RepID=A0A811NHR2_9POAL|nr:unnamed protein product [Miscanthus lutarioriparius]
MATARALRLVVTRPPATTRDGLLAAARRRLLCDAPSDDYMDRPPRFSGAEEATGDGGRVGKHPVGKAEAAAERVPPFAPSGKKPPLAGSEHELADPTAGALFTQKRRVSSSSSSSRERERDPREAATPGGPESAARKVREDDREYYRTHKPSPLAEVDFADTRKPITRATDGSATDRYADVPGRMVEDTVDDSLARAEAMFREAAARGNPEWPHSRALAQMLARRELGKDAAGSGKPCWGS